MRLVVTRRLHNTFKYLLANEKLDENEKKIVKLKLADREELLIPIYRQVAAKFADLHDTPGSLLKKGCISGVLKWKTSRVHLYWRLKRLLLQNDVRKRCREINSELTLQQIDVMLRRWFIEDLTSVKVSWFLNVLNLNFQRC